MWVEITSTYAGEAGLFTKGDKRDVPNDLLGHIPKDCYKRCKPPWEADKAKARADIRKARAETKAQAEGEKNAKQKTDNKAGPAGQRPAGQSKSDKSVSKG